MADRIHCEKCCKYNKESGLCRNNWIIPDFDGNECEFFCLEKSEGIKVQETEKEMASPIETIPVII